jgi:tetratricopeptide (TPR) repeat protein
MLPDALFHPLDLELELDEACEAGGNAATALLEEALTDPRARGDENAVDYLHTLADLFAELGQSREAIASLRRIAGVAPGLAAAAITTIADLHARLGENDVALELLTKFHDEQALLPADERALDFCLPAAMVLGEFLEDRETAVKWLDEGAELARERGLSADELSTFEYVKDLFGGGRDPMPGLIDRLASFEQAPPQRQAPTEMRLGYLPEAEYAAAREQGLLDPTMYHAHVDYRRENEETLRRMTASTGYSAVVVPFDVPGLLAYASGTGKDPANRQTRLDYALVPALAKGAIPWPPERNAPCWCGSARKYKKCCGAPGFPDVPKVGPASIVLKVELDDVDPPVWRRFAAPSELRFDRLHDVIQAYMGWNHEHSYQFSSGRRVISPPDTFGAGFHADKERLVSFAVEQDTSFSYVYDMGDNWSHTVTVEEIREAGDINVPVLIDGAGACPPEDCGGAHGYRLLLKALKKPSAARHGEAVEWLGEDFDPGFYSPK